MGAQGFDCLCCRVTKARRVAAIDPVHRQLISVAELVRMAHGHRPLSAFVLIVCGTIDPGAIRKFLLLQAPHSSRELQAVSNAVWSAASQQFVIHKARYAMATGPPLFSDRPVRECCIFQHFVKWIVA